ncbi:MAG: uncharacterized protein A8A55_2759 [Amphiamblys sp. WSBS2006]|nr:MAG: uncharacterized protein A8A55_2759 [Amphiamblys sp. WSBS2006]
MFFLGVLYFFCVRGALQAGTVLGEAAGEAAGCVSDGPRGTKPSVCLKFFTPNRKKRPEHEESVETGLLQRGEEMGAGHRGVKDSANYLEGEKVLLGGIPHRRGPDEGGPGSQLQNRGTVATSETVVYRNTVTSTLVETKTTFKQLTHMNTLLETRTASVTMTETNTTYSIVSISITSVIFETAYSRTEVFATSMLTVVEDTLTTYTKSSAFFRETVWSTITTTRSHYRDIVLTETVLLPITMTSVETEEVTKHRQTTRRTQLTVVEPVSLISYMTTTKTVVETGYLENTVFVTVTSIDESLPPVTIFV